MFVNSSLTHHLEGNSLRIQTVLVGLPTEAIPDPRMEAKSFIQDGIPGSTCRAVGKSGSKTKKRRQPMETVSKQLGVGG